MAQKNRPKEKKVKEPITVERLQQLIEEAVGPDLGEMPHSVAIGALTYKACMVAAEAVCIDFHDRVILGQPGHVLGDYTKDSVRQMAETMFLGVYPRTASLYLANPLGGGGIERPGPVILQHGPGGGPPRG